MHITIQHATASAVLLVAETEKGPVQRTVRPGESAWGWSFDLWSKQASGLMDADAWPHGERLALPGNPTPTDDQLMEYMRDAHRFPADGSDEAAPVDRAAIEQYLRARGRIA
jgi:hypothetical protein